MSASCSRDTSPCRTSISAAAAVFDAFSASRRCCSCDVSETTDRRLLPTHLIRPYAIPTNASASAPYLKLTGTVAIDGGRVGNCRFGPSRSRQTGQRVDALRQIRVIPRRWIGASGLWDVIRVARAVCAPALTARRGASDAVSRRHRSSVGFQAPRAVHGRRLRRSCCGRHTGRRTPAPRDDRDRQ